MNNFELSPEAQEAMRGDFVLAGEDGQPAATAEDFGVTSAATVHPGLPSDLVEATKEYLDPVAPMSLNQQMEFNSLIMGAMGLHVPHNNLSIMQSNKLEYSYNSAFDNVRLLVTPLFPSNSNMLQNRRDMLRNIRVNFSTALSISQEPLWTPGMYGAYGQLLQNPNITSDKDGGQNIKTGLQYRSPLTSHTSIAGPKDVVDRQTYLDQLHSHDLVVTGANNTLWTYNFVDIRSTTPRSPNEDVQALFEYYSSATNTPEQELAVQALHLITDQQNTAAHANITNEAVYALDRKGQPEALRRAAGVDWDRFNGLVHQNIWRAGKQNNNMGVRDSVRAL